jgi:hypothetical protein
MEAEVDPLDSKDGTDVTTTLSPAQVNAIEKATTDVAAAAHDLKNAKAADDVAKEALNKCTVAAQLYEPTTTETAGEPNCTELAAAAIATAHAAATATKNIMAAEATLDNTAESTVGNKTRIPSAISDVDVGGGSGEASPNLIVIVILAVVGFLFIVGVAIFCWWKQHNKVPPHQAPHIVENAAYVDPANNRLNGKDEAEQLGARVPHDEEEEGLPPIPPAGAVAAPIVQPVAERYEEADPNRAPIYDQGRLAGAASHLLRDQRLAFEAADYEEFDEGAIHANDGQDGGDYTYGNVVVGSIAPALSKRRNKVPAADWCHRAAPTGGTCTNAKVSGSKYCTSHMCEHPDCTQTKSSSVTACPEHLHSRTAGEEGGVAGTIKRGARKQSVYSGFEGGGDDNDLDC